MRQALARPTPPRKRQPVVWAAQEGFLPAPGWGWDTDTPVAELPLTHARTFDNWVPAGTQIKIRKGMSAHVTGLGAAVETLMPYNAGAASALFGAASTAIYNVTSAGAVGAAVVTGQTNARYSHTNITTSGGSFLWLCNGADDPQHWNGSAWAVPALTITTYTDNDISYVLAFKERLFFVFKQTLTMGYLPIQQVAGTVSNFPLGAVFNRGGRLVALGSVSVDGGDGIDDYFVALTSEGEIAVYQGFNPASATEWALVGVYYVGEPVGDRPLVDMGDDLGVITLGGLISIKSIMASGGEETLPLSARIGQGWKALSQPGQGFTGWEGIVVPAEDLLVINAPASAATARQIVRHRLTKGWGRFTGWNFETFAILSGDCYAGGSDGTVYLAFDDFDDDGEDVTASVDTAWTMLGNPQLKTLLEVRPLLTVATLASLRMVGRTDFRDRPVQGAWPTATVVNAGIWDVTNWDECLWSGEDQTTRQWRAISGEGISVSLAVEARINQSEFAINGFNLRYSVGGQV